jgi:hypothetical protein
MPRGIQRLKEEKVAAVMQYDIASTDIYLALEYQGMAL